MSSKYNIKIAPGAIVCNECELKGDITIGTKTVIHPKAKIIAESGPIIIGRLFFSRNFKSCLRPCGWMLCSFRKSLKAERQKALKID